MVNQVFDHGKGHARAVEAGVQLDQVAPAIVAGKRAHGLPASPVDDRPCGGLQFFRQAFYLHKQFGLKQRARGRQRILHRAMVPELPQFGNGLQNVGRCCLSMHAVKQGKGQRPDQLMLQLFQIARKDHTPALIWLLHGTDAAERGAIVSQLNGNGAGLPAEEMLKPFKFNRKQGKIGMLRKKQAQLRVFRDTARLDFPHHHGPMVRNPTLRGCRIERKKMSITREAVMELLKQVNYPGLNRDLVSFGMVQDVEIREDRINVYLEVVTKDMEMPRKLDQAVRTVLEGQLPVRLEVLTRLKQPESGAGHEGHGGHGHGGAPDPNTMPKLLSNVKHVIAVASGKGGVGKSAVASNLAVALAQAGYRVGLLDADIYGPSVQLVMGSNEPPMVQNNKIVPLESHGVHMISIGNLVDGGEAMIWRGPMVMQALTQLMQDVIWPELDFMVVDMPPGTGDAQLTMAQRVKLSGAVVVTTPQEMALIDARRAIAMFRKVDIPVLGLVENMSWFQCPESGKRYPIFGEKGGEREAAAQGVPLLAEIPLDPRIREGGDSGLPIVLQEPIYAEIYDSIVSQICQALPQA